MKLSQFFTAAVTLMAASVASAQSQSGHVNANHPGDTAARQDCRFGRGPGCYGFFNGSLWVETIYLTEDGNPGGKMKKYKDGDQLVQIDQQNNAYAGYKLSHLSFTLERASLFEPEISLFVNGGLIVKERVDTKDITQIRLDVKDCPLELFAAVSRGAFKVRSVSFYWEDPYYGGGGGGYPGPIPGPGGNIGVAANQLLTNIRILKQLVSPEDTINVLQPIQRPATEFRNQLQVCGAVCAQKAALELVRAEESVSHLLDELALRPKIDRYVQAVQASVAKIKDYYRFDENQ